MLPALHSAAFWNFMMYFCMFLGGAVLAGAFLTLVILTAVMVIRAIIRWLSPPLEMREKSGTQPFYPHPPAPLKYDVNGFAQVHLSPLDHSQERSPEGSPEVSPDHTPASSDTLEKTLHRPNSPS